MIKIPIYQPVLDGNEKKYVNECLDSTWISSKGKFIGEFEASFAEKIGVAHAATVSNGTVALHVSLLALGIGPGDEVIVPTLTYVASVNAISYTGATPVFVDSLPDSWQMDPSEVEAKITARTKAILVVHLYGHPCEMERLQALSRNHNLHLIEDCAEAFGSTYDGRSVGTFGDVATFSFFGNKTITTGEGGMVSTNDPELDRRVRHLKGQGLAENKEYWHDIIGYNYRMTNICAAIGLAQLERADEFIEKKRRIAQTYKEQLAGLPLQPHGELSRVRHTYWMFSILMEQASDRDKVRLHLAEQGIETRPVFPLVSEMPMYSSAGSTFPVAQNLSERGINLPSWPNLSDEQLRLITNEVGRYFNK